MFLRKNKQTFPQVPFTCFSVAFNHYLDRYHLIVVVQIYIFTENFVSVDNKGCKFSLVLWNSNSKHKIYLLAILKLLIISHKLDILKICYNKIIKNNNFFFVISSI